MGKLWAVVNALYHGKSLANPEAWKNVQMGTNAVLVVLAVVPQFFPELDLTPDQYNKIADAVMIVGGSIFNAYFTAATSEKVGIKKKK